MTALVTIEQVKGGLRIDHDDDDAWLGMLIGAASDRIVQFLKSRAAAILDLDSAGEPGSGGVPPEVETATIMLVGYLYRSPDADAEKDWARGFIPAPISALLYPLRDPALA